MLFLLKQLITDQLSFQKHKYGSKIEDMTHVSVAEDDFIDKAKQLNIKNIKAFYDCEYFKMNKFQYDAAKKMITQAI